jgi:hypothetical protein
MKKTTRALGTLAIALCSGAASAAPIFWTDWTGERPGFRARLSGARDDHDG